jgi:dTDP-4-amino-4,6-dideoxygalactose transaminase
MDNSTAKIELQKPFLSGKENLYLQELFATPQIFIKRVFAQKCKLQLQPIYGSNIFLTPNCTSSLEIIALAENISNGDEVIMPSFTYVSTANAFVRNGATPVFVDISPKDLNIDIALIEAAITPRTKAIVVMHYGGVACDLARVKKLSQQYGLLLIEDAAHGFGATFNESPLGTIGDYGVISFDHTKNIQCGQGGLLIVNNKKSLREINHIFENGTNRNDFIVGQAPYFEWVSIGSKFYLSDLNAAFLLAQLEFADEVLKYRLKLWNSYYELITSYHIKDIDLVQIPPYAHHNAHIFFIKLKDLEQRNFVQKQLNSYGIESAFHFIPLHSSLFGKQIAKFHGVDSYTTHESNRLLRLPLHNELTLNEVRFVCETLKHILLQ